MEHSDLQTRKQERIFWVMSVLFFVYWAWYSIHVIGTWRTMSPRAHLDSSGLSVFSFGLWLMLFREKANGYTMMMAAFAFIAAARLLLSSL